MKDLLINFHGFLSSHKSDNAVEFRREVISNHGKVESLSPCLPDNPEARVIVIEELIRESLKFHRTIGLVGYSLGGSFSTFTQPQNTASKQHLQSSIIDVSSVLSLTVEVWIHSSSTIKTIWCVYGDSFTNRKTLLTMFDQLKLVKSCYVAGPIFE